MIGIEAAILRTTPERVPASQERGHSQTLPIGAMLSWPAVRPIAIRPAGRMAAEWVEAPGGTTDRSSPGALS